jgi:hypothetical protein
LHKGKQLFALNFDYFTRSAGAQLSQPSAAGEQV